MSGTFLNLSGMEPQKFFGNFWMKQPTILEPESLSPLFQVSEDELFDWYVARAATDTRFTTFNAVHHSRAAGRARLDSAFANNSRPIQTQLRELARSEAFIVRDMADLPEYKELCGELAAFCKAKISLNCYLVQPGADHFPLHQDGHHIFAIQSVGEKEWSFWAPTVALPLARYRWHKEPPEPSAPLVLRAKAGQVVYIPTGWRHQAEADTDTSIHFSLGLHSLRWINLLRDVCEHAGSRSAALRDYLPFAVTPDGFRYSANSEFAAQLFRLIVEQSLEESVTTVVEYHNQRSHMNETSSQHASKEEHHD